MIPFYGDPELLKETVHSLVAQDDPRWRATVLDDGYPDPAASAWVTALGDRRLTVRRSESNQGVTETYRWAIRQASADWVTILGCDDRLLPGYVGRVRHLARQTGAAIIQPGVRVIDAHGAPATTRADEIKARLRPAPFPAVHRGQRTVAGLLRGNWTYFPSLSWRVDRLRRVPLRDYEVVQDLGLLVDLLVRGECIVVDDRITFEYRRHAASVSASLARDGRRFEQERGLAKELAGELRALGWTRAARAARTRVTSRAHAASLVPAACRTGDVAGAVRLARHALV
jgi:glycosyltransferase involved in cell wall biosynthesis